MLFNSVVFLFFFVAVQLVFWHLPGRARKYWILAASLVFYGYWDWRFLLHFVAVVLINYGLVRMLLADRRKWLIVLAVVLNLANLAFFKYTNSLLSILGERFGVDGALTVKENLGLILPLAISFYSFQIIAFAVDVWRREITEIKLVDYAVFIFFFPQLIAGPIMRHGDFLRQIDNPRLEDRDIPAGLYLIGFGVIKKVLIADPIAVIINPIWAKPEVYSTEAVWAAVIGFTAQVYCDFSGYTDMARGQARLLGYRIPENFFSPYLSTSFTELWRRWHVTLSTWLRDYLYIPLGGNRVAPWRLQLNIVIVMSLGGLWHGNTYTFFLWGFMHGVLLVIERALGMTEPARDWKSFIPRNIIVMVFWIIGAIFFRGRELSTVFGIYVGLFGGGGDRFIAGTEQVFQLSAGAWVAQILRWHRGRVEFFLKRHWAVIIPIATIILFYLVARIERPAAEFIYFQF